MRCRWPIIIALAACLLAAPAAAEPFRTYESSAYGWAITYPSSWQVDDSRPNAVMFTSDELRAMCGIHAGEVRFETLREFVDFMLGHMAQTLRQKGLESETLWRREIRLRTGQPAVEALVAMRPGGMSHRLFVLVSHRSVGIDCEAAEANWPRVTRDYDQIIASLRVVTIGPSHR